MKEIFMLPSLKIKEIAKKLPHNLLPSLHEITFICPQCRGDLKVLENRYLCENCRRDYVLHDGIPDFRLFPDPFLSYKEDFNRTEIVLAALEKLDFEKLLEHYWSFSDITPVALRPKYIKSALLGEIRAIRTLEILKDKIKNPVKKVLEIGSGTGNFLAAAANSNYQQIIGIDVAMRWLHLSRRRFMDAGLPVPPLVCCNAEFLPFADKSFDLIVASSTMEFVSDRSKVLNDCARVLEEKGSLYVNSVNRFSISKDPYAHLWGVGFLPRRWQAAYVKWKSDASYENVRIFSLAEFDRWAEKKFPIREFNLPEVSASAIKEFPLKIQRQIKIYQILKKIPIFSALLKYFGPGWDIILRKDKG